MSEYLFTKNWFPGCECNTQMNLYVDSQQENRILEIGCLEGSSSIFFADYFLDHPNSTLTCVDPFLHSDHNDHRQFLTNDEETRFDHNITVCKNANKISAHKITSDQFFENNTKTFTFIYIDGSHEVDYIKRDMDNSFKVLEKGGIMWMDDYLGGDGVHFYIKERMDEVLKQYEGQYERLPLPVNYQLAIKKL